VNQQALTQLVDQTREEVRIKLALRVASWEVSPGNTTMGHVWLNAMGYHTRWHQWDEARQRLLALEQRLADMASAGVTP